MAYPYRVALDAQQRAALRGLVDSGIAPAQTVNRAGSCSKPTTARVAPAGPTPRSPGR